MATLFYDHLIDWKKLTEALNALGIDGDERLEVLEHIEHLIHSEVLVVVVQQLPQEKHEEFIERFYAAPHDPAHIQYLTTYGQPEIEESIRQRSNELVTELIQSFLEDETEILEE